VIEEKERLSKIDMETEMPYEDLIAVMETNKGIFEMAFFHDTAPKHVENFIKLARDGFYDSLTFHRYEPGFVIQGGDPTGTGQGGPGYEIPAEISDSHKHVKGAVGMARLGDQENPERESSGSQFYICLGDAPPLDGAYTIWAEVIDGMDVVLELRQGDEIVKTEIKPKSDETAEEAGE
jgi:peptidyl-prolyl cis-trans isomerase B (cyclophilin B)